MAIDPMTAATVLSAIGSAGTKAKDLTKVFFSQMDNEESKIKLFLKKLINKPLTWIFTLIFSPLIIMLSIWKVAKRALAKGSLIKKFKLGVLLFGLFVGGFFAWLASGYLGTVSGFFLIKSHFGIFTATGFVFGTTFSIVITAIYSIIVYQIICFGFLKLAEDSVIQSVCNEFL